MTEELVPFVVGVDMIPSFSEGEMSFGPLRGRVLFHVEVLADSRVVTRMRSPEALAETISSYVKEELTKKLPKFDTEDECSRETYEAFLRYRKEMVDIWQRHKDKNE